MCAGIAILLKASGGGTFELVSLNDPEVCARACAQLFDKMGELPISLPVEVSFGGAAIELCV